MYYLNLKTGKSVQITNDGSKNIFNGISDWVYEARFSKPRCKLYIYDTTKETRKKNNLKKVVYEKDYEFQPDNLVILQVLWATEDSKNLLIRTSNRVQDTARLFSVNIPHEIETESDITKEKGTFIATFLKEDDHDDDGWLTRTESIYFVPPNGYIEIMEDKNGYEHINYYPDIYDEKIHVFNIWRMGSRYYYISTEEGSMQKHLYKKIINLNIICYKIKKQKEIINSFGENLSETGVFSASFSPGFNFYLLNYDGPNIPYQKILSTQDCKFDKELKYNYYENKIELLDFYFYQTKRKN
ncbi:dipeptidyl peptidase IV/CD26, N-terminal domain-containing protein [Piromyces finnis]|uniref:Dipeptidyl peptidase IV/CD26, N-terminal domain-containing protein n=1 Tax=Piromyces finnis TaxID=1754191 RepID=A0A1Y1U9Y6_9FUNG|nr:dipeptidyl peptidase IV/CD26, N-terminal domain-containing protein [Piromyces finnis]|eukprot:ORX34327.1 dipeptidyl peptidase IV/CD26, N-terminal domain-containing protein [Piromyces finnis]